MSDTVPWPLFEQQSQRRDHKPKVLPSTDQPTSELPPSGSELSRYCQEQKIYPQVSPGLDADSPGLYDPGDLRYAMGKELGHGGSGCVRIATDRHLRRSVALKTISPERRDDPAHIQAFLEEAIITGGLEHPNIVSAYDLGVSPDLGPYYTMKRLSGEPLSAIFDGLRNQQAELVSEFTLFRLLGCFIEICRAVVYAHAHGVIHSDLKPENIIIGKFGEVVVVDWGLALVLGPTGKTQARARIHAGTPEYMAPEQITNPGSELDVRTDIWALGLILYEILTLTVPFKGDNVKATGMKVLLEPLVAPHVQAPSRHIPRDVEAICLRALEKERDRRYPAVAEMMHELENYMEGTHEQMRRAEVAQQAIATVRKLLEQIQEQEQRLDEQMLVNSLDAQEQSRHVQQHIALIYRNSMTILLQGLDEGGDAWLLGEEAGELYWRIFKRIYPPKAASPQLLRSQVGELLTRLSTRNLSAILRVGRKIALSHGWTTASQVREQSQNLTNHPWLTVVRMFSSAASSEDDTLASSPLAQIVERISFLQKIPLFSAVKDYNLLPLANAFEEICYSPGQSIFKQGEPGDALCVIVEGQVDVVRDNSVINTLGPGDFFGEIAILGDTPRTAGIIALDHVVCLKLAAAQFREIVVESGEIGLALVHALNKRLQVATEREAALRRLANAVLASEIKE